MLSTRPRLLPSTTQAVENSSPKSPCRKFETRNEKAAAVRHTSARLRQSGRAMLGSTKAQTLRCTCADDDRRAEQETCHVEGFRAAGHDDRGPRTARPDPRA